MGQRVIPCDVLNEYITGAGVVVGAAGSHDEVLLELDFRAADSVWAGTTRVVTFRDALSQNPVDVILGVDLLSEGHADVYLVPIPARAKAIEGEMRMTIRGVIVQGDKELVRVVTKTALFRVLPSELNLYDENADVPASAAEQLQHQIDTLKSDLIAQADRAEAAKQDAETARDEAQTAESGAKEAQRKAEAAQGKAEDAQAGAESAKDDAEAALSKAKEAQTKAETARTGAETAQNAAEDSARRAAASQEAAAKSEANAKASEENALRYTNNAYDAANMSLGYAQEAEDRATDSSNFAQAAVEAAERVSETVDQMKSLVVNISGSASAGYTANLTTAEIAAAWEAGRSVHAKVGTGSTIYHPDKISATGCSFSSFFEFDGALYRTEYVISSTGNVTKSTQAFSFPNAEEASF